MPHSALQAGQYSKWRSGKWESPPTGRGRRRGPSYTLSVMFDQKTAWDLEQLEPNTFFPIASCVVFARNTGQSGISAPLSGSIERWRGKAGSYNVQRDAAGITDTSIAGDSPYRGYARQGAVIVPRCLFYVNETENTAIVRVAPTVTVNPRRGSQDKAPWRDLDLTEITGQTIEDKHLFDVHLGETVAPYVTLEPLKALLPLKHGDEAILADPDGPGGIRMGGLERRMRERWQTVSRMWDHNKAPVNRLSLLGQLDYLHKLSSQLEWQHDNGERPFRIAYTSAGQPTATLIDDDLIVDYKLFWVSCQSIEEANYLLAIINSEALAAAVNQYTTPNWAGNTRDLQKHLWKLPIPGFDPAQYLHTTISEAGAKAASGAAAKLAQLHEMRSDKLTVTIARRELRTWLRASVEGRAVEAAVGRLLAAG